MKKALKILYVIPNLKKGGAERLVLDICNELQKREMVRVKLITFSNDNAYEFLTENIDWEVCPAKVMPSITSKSIIELDNYIKIVKDFEPDIIHSHLFEAEIVTREIVFSDIVYYTHLHGGFSQIGTLSLKMLINKSAFIKYYDKMRLKKKYEKCNNNFIAISNDTYSVFIRLMPYFRNKVKVLLNAIDTSKFLPSTDNHLISGMINLISIGSLCQRKNHVFLLKVVSFLKQNGMDIRLVILGDGENRLFLEKQILIEKLEENVILAGNIDDVNEYLNKSDIYVHSAINEPFGLAILEAMAAGLPIVSLTAGGNEELVVNNKNGYLVANDNINEFCNKIKYLINNKIIYKRMSDNSLNYSKNYKIENYIDKLLKYYFIKIEE